jgi:3-methylfumaryl-CoA hydratase
MINEEPMTNSEISPFKEWIGKSVDADDVLTSRLVDEYRATLAPHLFTVGALEAPLALHWCLAPPTAPLAELGPDGHPAKGGFLPPVPLPRRMWAGGEIEFLGALQIGDKVVRHSTIADISMKEGKSGSLCFVAITHDYSTAAGPVIRERQDIVYREAAGEAAPAPQQKPAVESAQAGPGPDLVWRVDASPVLLFRYSAITFNSHRIHYDHAYAFEVEGYPGLVVHGPLQASLLLNLAATFGGKVPRRFAYRGVAPMFLGAPFELKCRKKSETELECWSEDALGRTSMKATVFC